MPPLDLVIKEKALISMLRVLHHNRSKWSGLDKKGIGHIRYLQNNLIEMGIDNKVFDNENALSIRKDFKVDFDSFKSGLPISDSEIQCYTDGSKLENKAGYGLGIYRGMCTLNRDNGYLGSKNSVFQSEVTAILKSCDYLENYFANSITIFSDSQSALAALAGFNIKSKIVAECIEKLNLLSAHSTVELKYVRAHSDFTGNEVAGADAKLGTKNIQNKVEVHPPISWAKLRIKREMYSEWCRRWYQLKIGRQTRIWFPSINKRASRYLLTRSRKELGLMTQMITGHCRLNRHQSLIDPGVSPTCRLCGEEAECSWHVIGRCPMLRTKRWEYLGGFELENPPDWSPSKLLKFLLKAKIDEMNEREDNIFSQIP